MVITKYNNIENVLPNNSLSNKDKQPILSADDFNSILAIYTIKNGQVLTIKNTDTTKSTNEYKELINNVLKWYQQEYNGYTKKLEGTIIYIDRNKTEDSATTYFSESKNIIALSKNTSSITISHEFFHIVKSFFDKKKIEESFNEEETKERKLFTLYSNKEMVGKWIKSEGSAKIFGELLYEFKNYGNIDSTLASLDQWKTLLQKTGYTRYFSKNFVDMSYKEFNEEFIDFIEVNSELFMKNPKIRLHMKGLLDGYSYVVGSTIFLDILNTVMKKDGVDKGIEKTKNIVMNSSTLEDLGKILGKEPKMELREFRPSDLDKIVGEFKKMVFNNITI